MNFLSKLFRRPPKLVHTVQGDHQTFGTEVWNVTLPLNWTLIPQSGDTFSFETPDKAKGLYITTLKFGSDTSHNAPDIAKQLKGISQKGLTAMEGYNWALLQDIQSSTVKGCIATLDAHDAQRGYRICTKIMVELPHALRASFHDYGCENIVKSQAYFASPLDSLRINGTRF